nr:MAG TPA: hypothetical protein [Caudoviricetes sp.]
MPPGPSVHFSFFQIHIEIFINYNLRSFFIFSNLYRDFHKAAVRFFISIKVLTLHVSYLFSSYRFLSIYIIKIILHI